MFRQILKFWIGGVLFFTIQISNPTQVCAQFEVGVSYELREESPQNGFGLKIERGLLPNIPLVNIGTRIHFSHFSEDNNLTQSGITFSEEVINYDLGIALVAGINVGIIEPYAGLGIGSEEINITTDLISGLMDQSNPMLLSILSQKTENNLYWNALVGAKISVLPVLRPFIEYRYTDTRLGKPRLEQFSPQVGRVIVGIAIKF